MELNDMLIVEVMYSIIVMKLNLTTGLVPTLNVSAALLAFVFLRTWTKLLNKLGIATTPFTQQENTVVQTCAVACYSIAVGGGFGSFLLGLNKKTYEQAGIDTEGNTPWSYKEPGIGWMTEGNTPWSYKHAIFNLIYESSMRKVSCCGHEEFGFCLDALSNLFIYLFRFGAENSELRLSSATIIDLATYFSQSGWHQRSCATNHQMRRTRSYGPLFVQIGYVEFERHGAGGSSVSSHYFVSHC